MQIVCTMYDDVQNIIILFQGYIYTYVRTRTLYILCSQYIIHKHSICIKKVQHLIYTEIRILIVDATRSNHLKCGHVL